MATGTFRAGFVFDKAEALRVRVEEARAARVAAVKRDFMGWKREAAANSYAHRLALALQILALTGALGENDEVTITAEEALALGLDD